MREAILASLIAGVILVVFTSLASDSWFAPLGAGLLWLLLNVIAVRQVRRRAIFFVAPMSREAAHARIRSADKEIWSFQISGSEFTAHSVAAYEAWLQRDPQRRLKVAFANPANEGLLHSIVRLSGVHRISNKEDAFRHLRQTTLTSLRRYAELRARFPTQVDLRVYDCSPPFSIHACDPVGDRACSIYVEFYLPDLAPRERPCTLMPKSHSKYQLYVDQSKAWFDQASNGGGSNVTAADS